MQVNNSIFASTVKVRNPQKNTVNYSDVNSVFTCKYNTNIPVRVVCF